MNTTDKIKLSGPSPDVITRLTVQVVENLRFALDHATCAVVPAVGRGKTYFPFGDTKAKFIATLRGKRNHIPDDIKPLFEGFNTYKRGNSYLWALNKLANTHKHRTIVEPSIIARDVMLGDVPLSYSLSVLRPVWDRRKNEITFSKVRGQGTIHYDIEFSLGIAFGKVKIFQGMPVLSTLRGLTSEVKLIVSSIESESRRLGITK